MINGIIFQREENRTYKGVDGDNWYLNDIFPNVFEEFYSEYIERSWYDPDCVDVCNDYLFIDRYIELSKSENIKFRMLLCETEKMKPQLPRIIWPTKFLGFDYAYLGGSYYSAVYNDVYHKRIAQLKDLELNSNGLFDDLTKVQEFIQKRERLMKQNNNIVLERGDFTVYKLSEIVLN